MSRVGRSKSEKVPIFTAGSGSQVVHRISEEQAIELERQGVIERAPVPRLFRRGVVRYDNAGQTERLGFRLVSNSRFRLG
jgi:hypothetical protein